jgi:signal transduction histidine kinase
LGQHTSIIFQYKEGDISNPLAIQQNDWNWTPVELTEPVLKELNSLIPQESSTWIRTNLKPDIVSEIPILKEPLLLALKIPQQQNTNKIILINIEHYCYGNDFKATLEIAANQFTDIVQKRSTETMLSTKYSQLKQAIKLLRKTQKQLTHNEKMVSLGQLAAGIAHEINNPLSYLSSNLETLQDYIKQYESIIEEISMNSEISDKVNEDLSYLKEDSKELLAACLNGVMRVSEIVTNLKQFSKKGTQEFSKTNLIEVITDSLAIVTNKLKYKHNVDICHESKCLEINGNFGQLQQVFVNLFINAIDAMVETGVLSIKSFVRNNEAIILINDNGVGIENETIARIFEPFFTTKGDSKGTGLGLSVSYAIITKHNATISVDSIKNKGTTFTLKFPHYITP